MTHPTSPIVFLIVRVRPKNQKLERFRKCEITFPSLLPPLSGPSALRPEFVVIDAKDREQQAPEVEGRLV